ncbi:MAG: iron-containing alcohol dehydrogenase [Clostridia bacterium]|nr:iron-containing alcohol dehydrogenase [Clostridia bacterium]
MTLDFGMPAHLIGGKGCVRANPDCFRQGSRALLVTGRHSAVACGAQKDVTDTLESLGISWSVFDRVEENPRISLCREAGLLARSAGADFVIGIGGGSAMDAAKAVAAFSANPEMPERGIFEGGRAPSLPILLIPTTAGTGSESNPYSVLTLDGEGRKKTFNDRSTNYARFAFLDATYTMSLPERFTRSCAIDAFAHCAESFFSPKSDPYSRMCAVWGAQRLWRYLKTGKPAETLSFDEREELLYASCAAGMAINRTGTGFPHPLGYNLTLRYGIPHGFACGIFYREYLSCCEKGDPAMAASFYEVVGAEGEELKERIPALSEADVRLDEETINRFVATVKDANGHKNAPYRISEAEMKDIYRRLFSA